MVTTEQITRDPSPRPIINPSLAHLPTETVRV